MSGPLSAHRHQLDRRRFLSLTASAGLAMGLLACSSPGSDRAPATGTPQRGGNLRLGVGGGSTRDVLEPQYALSRAQQARMRQMYESLMAYDRGYQLQPFLAEEVTPDGEKAWVVRLREGVTFHNGKSLEAEDVVFSLQRILDPSGVRSGALGLAAVDRANIQAVDKRTVRIPLTTPSINLPQLLGEYYNTIVPRDFDIKNPVGTGPFKLGSFAPGQESRFDRYDGYWQSGQPLLDSVVVIDIPDDSARVNALLGDQIDCLDAVPPGQTRVIEAQGTTRILESEAGGFLPITMRCDEGPLSDSRVRLALKLIVDREQMVTSALDGHGRIANDLYSPFDPVYASRIPQRQRDIAQAKALLIAAGVPDLRFTMTVAPVASGVVETAQLLAEQAKQAGVTIDLERVDVPTFYGPNYGTWTSTVDVYGTRNYLSQVQQGSLPKSPFNTPHWQNPEFGSLYEQAMAEPDDTKRAAICQKMQTIEHNDGGNIIPFFYNYVDAYSTKVLGLEPDKGPTSTSGFNFRKVGFA